MDGKKLGLFCSTMFIDKIDGGYNLVFSLSLLIMIILNMSDFTSRSYRILLGQQLGVFREKIKSTWMSV
jgi:hypothetical protein